MKDIYSDEIRRLVILLWIKILQNINSNMTEFWFTAYCQWQVNNITLLLARESFVKVL